MNIESLIETVSGYHGLANVTMLSTLEWGKGILVKDNPLDPSQNASLRETYSVAELRTMRPTITKRTVRKIYVGPNIQARENKLAAKEGREPHVFGPLPDYEEWLVPNYIIRHKTSGKLYLRCVIEETIASEYYIDGRAVEPSEGMTIRQFLPKKKGAPPCHKLALDNIERLAVNNEVFE